jgi:hypothetical protein
MFTHTLSLSGCPLTQLKKYEKKIVNGIEKNKNKKKPFKNCQS